LGFAFGDFDFHNSIDLGGLLLMKMMIDLETWGTNPDAEIIAAGVVIFDQEIISKDLYVLKPQRNRQRDPETVFWWTQRHSILLKIQSNPKIKIAEFLLSIWKKYHEHRITEVWAKSPSFDLRILKHAFEEQEIKTPWSFREEMDVRTIQTILKKKKYDLSIPKIPHDPVYDAEAQTKDVMWFDSLVL